MSEMRQLYDIDFTANQQFGSLLKNVSASRRSQAPVKSYKQNLNPDISQSIGKPIQDKVTISHQARVQAGLK